MKQIKLKLTGIRPLILHNGLMADPSNPYTVAIKKITAKGSKKMTIHDYAERDRLEWEAGLYWSLTENAMVMPSDNIERCIQDGAKKSRLGKDFAAAVFMSEHEAVIHHRKSGKSKEDIYADPAFTIRKGVKVQLARIIRIRPMIPSGWWLHCTIEFDESIVNEAQVLASTQEAGSLCGIGDWRPKFGRFSVEKV